MHNPLRLTLMATLLIALVVSGCTTPPRGRSPQSNPDSGNETPERQTEDPRYDFEKEQPAPEAPGDVAFAEDELPPRPEDMNSGTLTEDPVASDPIDQPMDLPDPDAASTATPVQPTVTTPVPQGRAATVVRGFRVQLLAVTEQAKAQTLAQEAGQRLGVPVHVVLEAPHYKVRAGDFTDRGDAVRLKERAASLGYGGAWVVTDQIEVRK